MKSIYFNIFALLLNTVCTTRLFVVGQYNMGLFLLCFTLVILYLLLRGIREEIQYVEKITKLKALTEFFDGRAEILENFTRGFSSESLREAIQ